MNDADRYQVLEALEICSSYAPDKCYKCPYGWMEDHGEDCQPVVSEFALSMLKEKGFDARLYTMLIRANEQTFVDGLSVDQKFFLMQTVNRSNIQKCVCCPFFVVKNETCTLGTPDPDWNKKPEDCKLNRQEDTK